MHWPFEFMPRFMLGHVKEHWRLNLESASKMVQVLLLIFSVFFGLEISRDWIFSLNFQCFMVSTENWQNFPFYCVCLIIYVLIYNQLTNNFSFSLITKIHSLTKYTVIKSDTLLSHHQHFSAIHTLPCSFLLTSTKTKYFVQNQK